MARHAACHRVDGELHRHAAVDEELRHLPHLVLRLGHRHAVARHDNDLLREGHRDAGVAGVDGLLRTRDGAGGCAAGVTEAREQHVAEAAVHRLRHQLRQQRTGRAHHRTGDDHGGVLRDEAFERYRQTGEGVVQRDDDRHVRATDGQGHGEAEQQRQHEEQRDRFHAGVGSGGDEPTHHQGTGQNEHVHELLPTEAVALLDKPLQLAEGNARARERHATDEATQHGQRASNQGMFFTLVELHRSNGSSGAATHAVVERNHLRHVRHGHALSTHPRNAAANGDGHHDEHHVGTEVRGELGAQRRREEGDERGDEHATASPHDAATRRHRRSHTLQAHDEQERGSEIRNINEPLGGHRVEEGH